MKFLRNLAIAFALGVSPVAAHAENVLVVLSDSDSLELKDGKVSDVCVLQPVDPVVDRHAAQTVKGMPSFTPGQHDGKNVLVRMYMPITYQP